MPKWCVIQLGRWVSQLGSVPTFTQRRVPHMMSRCFLFLLICHWRWIGWRGQSNAGSCNMERTGYHHWRKKNLRVKHLRPVNPLEELAQTLLLQNY
jgi:hypothetical protein